MQKEIVKLKVSKDLVKKLHDERVERMEAALVKHKKKYKTNVKNINTQIKNQP